MNGNDIEPVPFRPRLSDLAVGTALLTRLPLPGAAFPAPSARPAAHAAWAYPLVGVLTGAMAAGVGTGAMALGLGPVIAALLALLGAVVMTGAMHEDGLADCADGFWGGWTRERRLEIMKDSQIGTYGVAALILFFGLRVAAIAALLGVGAGLGALILAAMLSRAAMVGVMQALPNARAGGLSGQTGRVPPGATFLGCGIAGAAAVLGAGADGAVVLVAAGCAALGCAAISHRKIGGQTGDVLGATQQTVEITVLLTCLAVI